MDKLIEELGNKVDKFISESPNKESIDNLKNEIEDLKLKADPSGVAFKEIFERIDSKFEELKETSKNSKKITLKEEISLGKKEILAIAKGEKKEVALKALSNRASITGNEQAMELNDIGQLATRKLSLYDIFPKITISESNNNGVIRYYDWDEATIARAAASVAEGAVFPESTAKFKKGTVVLEKIGDTLPVTEEFFEDEEMFASELSLFLQTNVDLAIDNQLCNGLGTGNTLTGVYTSAPAFVPVASGIPDANLFDLIVKVSESITESGGAKYNPDTIIARKSVINQMKLKKDANNNYVLPAFVSADGKNIDGMTVIESNIAPANTLIVCDKRFGRIYEKGGMVVSEGLKGDQFVEDEMTLKVRKRLAFLIREADRGGFRKVTNITTALTTLAT